METIDCYDCGSPVSFRAAACPQCGSPEPNGPYRHSKTEIHWHRIEERNDRRTMLFMLGIGAVGGFYGIDTAPSVLRAIIGGIFYSVVGASLGVAIAFTLNVTRNWR